MVKKSNINRGVSKSFEQRLEKVEKEEKTLRSENRTIKEYLYILTGIVGVLFIGYFILLKLTGFVLLDNFNSGSFTNAVSEGAFSHVTIGTDAPYSQQGGYGAQGLAGYYSFEGDNSVTAFDYSANGYDGTYNGNVVTATGLYGNAASFGGAASDYVSISGFSNAGLLSGYTVSLWVYPNNWDNANGNLFVMGGDAQRFERDTGTGKYMWISGSDIAYTDSVVSFGEWSLLTAVYDGTGITLYRNGVNGTRVATSAPASWTGTVVIGTTTNHNEAGRFLNGKIDELMIFDHPLTAGQISAIYANTSSRFAATSGTHTFDVNLGTNTTANITLGSYVVPAGTSISAQINSSTIAGSVVAFTNGVITGYTLPSGDLTSAKLNLIYSTDASRFLSPIAGGNISIDAWAPADTTSPSIDYGALTETNGSTITRNNIVVNVTASDVTALANITIRLYNSSRALLRSNTTSTSPNFINYTGLSNGIYYFNATAADTSNNLNYTSTYQVNISVTALDTTAPVINMVYPVNTTYNSIVTELNYTASDETALGSCWYSLNGGANSTVQTCNTNWTGLVATEGSNSWIVYVNDTSNNVNSSSVQFFVDSIVPGVNFTSPTSSGTVSGDAIYVNLTTSDTNEHYSFADLDRSLSLWLRMDNVNDSGEPIDSSSYSVNGSISNGSVQTNSGKFGKGFSFANNGAAHINVPVSSFNNPSTQITVSAWVNTNHLTDWGRIVGRDSFATANKYSWVLYQDTDNRTTFAISNGTIQKGQATATNSILNNTWYHFVGTYNGTAMFLYVNGALSTTTTLDANTTNIVFSSISYLSVGSSNALTSNSYLNGTVDEVMIFNRSLGASEILSLYNAAANQYEKNFTGLSYSSHSFTGYAVDIVGNKNQTETRTVTLEAPADTTFPLISVVYPTNTSYNSVVTELNYTASDETALSACWYYNGTGNTTITCGENVTGLTSSQDSNTWIVYVNDTSNNVNSSSVQFFVDSISPTIDYGVLADSNNSNVSRSNIVVNATSTDTNLVNITIRLYDSSKVLLQSNTTATSPNFINYTGLSEGVYYFNATSTDILNNRNNSATYIVRIDTTNPGIVYGNLADNSSNVSRNWIYVNVSITETNEANVTFTLYNTTGVVNVTTFGAGNRNINFTSLSDGTYTFNVSAADTLNHINTTETRIVKVDTVVPLITYGLGTENFNEIAQNNSGIYVNTTWIESNLANITFSLYTNGGTTVNTTVFTSAAYTINWTGLSSGAYRYQINITDLSNNKNFTVVRNITLLDSCFNAQGTQCSAEGQDCNITTSCYLYSSMCSGNVCDFNNFRINGTVYTLYQANGDANELYLNVSNITFIKSTLGNRGNYTQGIVFNGKVGSTISPGTRGGNAGLVNVTVPYFFNTTRANFTGLGGYSTLSGTAGGNGGLLYLQFFGLIRKFNDGAYFPEGTNSAPKLPAGGSLDSGNGTAGATTYGKIIDCATYGMVDVDINGDGTIDSLDKNLETSHYNNITTDNTFNSTYDISCDGKINVIEISKMGFQWESR